MEGSHTRHVRTHALHPVLGKLRKGVIREGKENLSLFFLGRATASIDCKLPVVCLLFLRASPAKNISLTHITTTTTSKLYIPLFTRS